MTARTGPVFVIGCPRSGTTLLLDLLARTRSFGYVTTGRTPGAAIDAVESVHARTRIYDAPLIGRSLQRHRRTLLGLASRLGPLRSVARRRLPTAIEPWEFWEDLMPNFRPESGAGPAADPDPADLAETDRDRARAVVADLLARQRRDVLLSKYTDFPRIDLMRSVFPGARFVHIRRDAFAVANSYAVEIESGRFGTWVDREWWSAAWPAQARAHWHASGATVLGFAAHNRNRLIDVIDRAVAAADAPVLTVSYEHLVADPEATLASVLSFAGLATRTPLAEVAGSRRLVDTSDRWRARRSADEAALLVAILSPRAAGPVS